MDHTNLLPYRQCRFDTKRSVSVIQNFIFNMNLSSTCSIHRKFEEILTRLLTVKTLKKKVLVGKTTIKI